MDRTRCYNMDCMEGMKEFPDKWFDLAIVDPPYGIDVASKDKMSTTSKKRYDIKSWDESTPDIVYFQELTRISKNQIIWGANFFDGFGLAGGGIVWNKLGTNIGRRNPLPDLSDCEYAYCSMRNNIKMFSYTQIGNVYGNDYQIDWEQDRIHPTQKPVALYKWLLKNYAKEGDKILDTHLGSGSSRIAAFDGGYDFTGYELDKDYFEAQELRFKRHKSQLKLFEV